MTYTAERTERTEVLNIDCPRCNGRGFLDEYAHIANGRCFLCGGARKINSTFKYNLANKKPPIVNFCKAANYKCHDRIEIWFDLKYGYSSEICEYITDSNRKEMRELWKMFKNNGARMQINGNDI